jgi:hypothetical protein
LFKRNQGRQAVAVTAAPPELDVAASRTGNTLFLHVANTEYVRSVEVELQVQGAVLSKVRVLEIAPEDARTSATPVTPNAFSPRERLLADDEGRWRLPARSVSVLVAEMREKA